MTKVIDLCTPRRAKEGEIGIEIEAEGQGFPGGGTYWSIKGDGSLRGEACEYVLKHPASRADYQRHLTTLQKRWTDNRTQFNNSTRTSVHVHINVQELTITQVYTFICLYLVLENHLIEWCGEHRKGNLFCLRAKDAEFLLYTLEEAIRSGDYKKLDSNTLRYASINVRALYTYGSLEFRAMRGTSNIDLISHWIEILLAIKDASLTFENPQQIIEDFSAYGPIEFHNKVFPNNIFPLNDTFPLKEGIRQVQNIAYAVDWKNLPKIKKMKAMKREPWPIENNNNSIEWQRTQWIPTQTYISDRNEDNNLITFQRGGLNIDKTQQYIRPRQYNEDQWEDYIESLLRNFQRTDEPKPGDYTISKEERCGIMLYADNDYYITRQRQGESFRELEERVSSKAYEGQRQHERRLRRNQSISELRQSANWTSDSLRNSVELDRALDEE
jgi:hypothetical protein